MGDVAEKLKKENKDVTIFESKALASDPIAISVVLLTYNHARFIGESLASIYEDIKGLAAQLIIYDDASEDGTSEAILQFSLYARV
jgi:hypothetical protein